MGVGGAIASIGSAIVGGAAAKKGADVQAQAARGAAGAISGQYQQTREDLMPWMETGGEQLNVLSGLMKEGYFERPFEMQEEPGYQFRLGEGEKALSRAQAARGDFFSGRAGKELGRYGQEFASNEYAQAYARDRAERQNRYSRLFNLSEAGRGAAGQLGGFGERAATNVGEAELYKGEAKASGYMGMAEALTGGMGGLAKTWPQ